MFLVLIDAHSKWIEAFNTASATSTAGIEQLRSLFAKFGLPETIMNDNGTCFVSTEFEDILQVNGIKHITSAPYHPARNGLAERAVQVVKVGLSKISLGNVRTRFAKILFTYRLTPQTYTAERIEEKQLEQKRRHDVHAHDRDLEVGNAVFVRNYHHGDKWIPGTIQNRTGLVSFKVLLQDGQNRRCHQDKYVSEL